MTAVFREPFPPKRKDKCFCNSGLRFKSCCGNSSLNRNPPYGVKIVESYLDSSSCDDIVQKLSTFEGEALTILDLERTTKEKIVRIIDDRRVTDKVLLGDYQSEINKLVELSLKNQIEPNLDVKIEWYERPTVLRYHPNGFYQAHADSDNYDTERQLWRQDLDRDISLLIYLNDDYEGGTLYFPYFDYRIKPQKGMLVYFPSDSRYFHAAESLISGTRYAIVSWSAILGNKKVRKMMPEEGIKFV